QLLAGLEEGNVLLRHADGRPGARVAPHARLSPLHREGAETAQLDPVPPGQGFADFVEDGRDDALHVTVVKVRIDIRDMLDQLRFCHSDVIPSRRAKRSESPPFTSRRSPPPPAFARPKDSGLSPASACGRAALFLCPGPISGQ